MPTYDYQCNQCGHNFEYFQSMSENPIKECPECNGAVRRLVGGGTGLIFKGSGFYLTDYVKNKKSKSDSPIKSKNGSKKTKSDGKKTSNEKTTKK